MGVPMKRMLSVMLLAIVGLQMPLTAADWPLEREVSVLSGVEVYECANVSFDLRKVIPILKLNNSPALRGISYSARDWRLDVPTDDPSRTANVIAQPGTIVDGVFLSGAGAAVTVLPATGGEGTVDWRPTMVEKCIYRLMHTASVGGTPDGSATYYGYFDFTGCDITRATQEEVEVAVFGGISHPISVAQDANLPWQPIENDIAGVGIATDAGLAQETSTATTFSFSGRGTLHFEYAFGDGSLVVRADGVEGTPFAASAEWKAGALRFEDFGSHVVAFVYAVANGGQAALRNVRWQLDDYAVRMSNDGRDVRMDLRDGVRTPKRSDEILPFVYSSTNWIGGVKGATAESKARVTIVQMKGSDPEVSSWTEEVADTFKELANESGEGEAKKWKPKKGVWKATFDILNGDTSIYSEDAWFDLRKTSTPGFMLMVF